MAAAPPMTPPKPAPASPPPPSPVRPVVAAVPPPPAAPAYSPSPAPVAASPNPPAAGQGGLPGGPPGGVRGWMIKMLGGKAADSSPASAPSPQAGAAWPVVSSDQWAGPQAAPAAPPAMPPIRDPELPSAPPSAEEPQESQTVGMPGADIGKLKFPTSVYTLQLRDKDGQWRCWAPIGANGLNIGRSSSSSHFPFLNSMAVRHLRLTYDGPQLLAEDLGSLNGVFVKISGPVELTDRTRIRVGSQVIEFRTAETLPAAPTAYSGEGEEFLSSDVVPIAYLDMIRPDNTVGLRFPLTKTTETTLGRQPRSEIALSGEEWVSALHAAVYVENGRFLVVDKDSRNGTFLQIRQPTPLKNGDILLVGRAFLRVVDQQGA